MEKVLQDLESDQREKIISFEGEPVFLTGPAGSGKTEVLKEKIRWLISSGGAKPDSILIFTDQEENMRDFLRSYLKPGFKESWINNFTAFGKKVLRQNYTKVPGIYPNFQVLDGLEEKLVLKKILKMMKLSYYKRVKWTAGFVDEVVDFIDLVKLNPKVSFRGFQKNGKFGDLGRIFQKYQDYLSRANRLDFRDLILKTIQLFTEHPEVLKKYQEKFTHIFLDDFQNLDLNQYHLFSLLAKGNKNVLFCGDVSEGVFRFRGALPEEVRDKFLQEFKPKEYHLEIASENTVSPHDDMHLVRCSSVGEEALFIAREIFRLMQEGYHYKDFAILCRGLSREIKNLEDALKIYNLNYTVTGGIAFFKQPEIIQIISILKCIWDEDEGLETDYLRTLSSPGLAIDSVDIQRLITYGQRRGIPLPEVIKRLTKKIPEDFYQENTHQLKDTTIPHLKKFLKILKDMKENADKEPLENFIYRVFLEFGYLHKARADRRASRNLMHFLDIVRKFHRIENNVSFSDFMGYLEEVLESYGREEPITLIASQDGIKITTVQQARGEFWPVVFVTGLEEGRFPRDFHPSPLVTLNEKKTLGLKPVTELVEHILEERRMFNLAITRAKDKLYLTYVQSYEGGQLSDISSFVLNLLGVEKKEQITEKCKEKNIEFLDRPDILTPLSKEEMLTKINFWLTTGKDTLESLFNEKIKEEYENIKRVRAKFAQKDLWDKARIKEDFSFSSYKLESYSDCPAKFFFKFLVKIYLPPKPHMAFGSLVHKILSIFHQKYNQKDKLLSPKARKDLLEILARVFSEEGDRFSTRFEREVYQDLAKRILIRYLDKERERENFYIEATELEFIWDLDNLKFRGRIDRLDRLEDGSGEIIDYKTGKSPSMEESLCRKMSDGELFQLPIYFFAAQEKLGKNIGRVSVYWLRKKIKEESSRLKATIQIDKKEKTFQDAKRQIKEKASGILRGYYPQEPKNCWGCELSFLCDDKVARQ
ncbi:ATP-dependent helicase [bacterium]|nr:ATP-dependent helicase [bacterium]